MNAKSALSMMVAALVCGLPVRAGWQGSAATEFAVKATMDSFVGKARSEPIAWAEGAAECPVRFQIATMETGKKKRDVEMQHMFHADQYPEVVGVAKADDLLHVTEGGAVPVALTLSGVTQEVAATIAKVTREEGALSFQARFDISLKAFGVKPPSIMKMIKVGDVVKVTTTFTLSSAAQP